MSSSVGLWRRTGSNPTLVNNAETLSNVPHILARGADWFRAMGTPESPGTIVATVVGDVIAPDVGEVELGTPLRTVIDAVGSGLPPGRSIKAVLSGVANTVVTARDLDVPLTYEGFEKIGSGMGSAGFIVYDDTADMVYQIMRLARFYAHESCAQCTQCREGTGWTVRILERILSGKGTMADLDLLLDIGEQMTGKTICVLSDSCAVPVASGLKKFRGEFEAYITGARKPVLAVA